MTQQSPQELAVSLLVGPVGVELLDTTLNHRSSGSVRRVGHRNSFERRLGRQDRRIAPVDHFDAQSFHQ
jgi:hypothetical protein